MNILISNDDGYRAPGIEALARAMRRFGRVTIVAPDHNHSGASNSLTLNRPLTVEHMQGTDLYVLSGTPSDCVHVALTGLLDEKPDLVVSGINCGANMGDDTMYSGTVAAAIEGYLFGVPSIAFSQIDKGWAELESAAKVASAVVERFIERREARRQTNPCCSTLIFRTCRLSHFAAFSALASAGARVQSRLSLK